MDKISEEYTARITDRGQFLFVRKSLQEEGKYITVNTSGVIKELNEVDYTRLDRLPVDTNVSEFFKRIVKRDQHYARLVFELPK